MGLFLLFVPSRQTLFEKGGWTLFRRVLDGDDFMQKFLPVKLAVLAAAALLLTGCPTAQKAQEGEVQQQAQASKGKIDTICVVRHQNAQLGNEKLVKAIEAGLQHTGVKTRVVEHNQVPADCRLCLFYGVTTDDKVAKSFDFQAVIDGKALQRGSGPVQPDGNIKLETVAQYAANYLQSLVNASKQKEAQQNGSEP